jgi:hypothetical protein
VIGESGKSLWTGSSKALQKVPTPSLATLSICTPREERENYRSTREIPFALMETCKQLRFEGTSMLFSKNAFVAGSLLYAKSARLYDLPTRLLLSTIPANSRTFLRNLTMRVEMVPMHLMVGKSIPALWRTWLTQAHEICSYMPHLSELRIELRFWSRGYLWRDWRGLLRNRDESKEEHLDGLCEELKRWMVGCRNKVKESLRRLKFDFVFENDCMIFNYEAICRCGICVGTHLFECGDLDEAVERLSRLK